MHEITKTHETWRYECMDCHKSWDLEYEVWFCEDGHGGLGCGYRLLDQPVMAPSEVTPCPRCGAYSVRTFPPRANP